MMDAILLARMRSAGLEDGMIRHLHDQIVRGRGDVADAARHMASTLVGGPVRFYGPEEGVTAELQLDEGIHWTGRGVRIAGRTLPQTLLAAMPGMRMSDVVEFDGAEQLTIDSAGTENGNTWIAATRKPVEPPERAGLRDRLRHRRELTIHAWLSGDARVGRAIGTRREATLLKLIGVALAATVIAGALLTWTGSHAKLAILGPMGALIGVLACLYPGRGPREDAERRHMAEMRDLQRAQGW